MITFRTGNILAVPAEALVNSVNCVGVMGRGIALQFKNAYPQNFRAYEIACERNEVVPGRMFVFETRQLTNPKFIINFPTKRHWRGKSRIEDIEAGLAALVEVLQERGIHSLAIPPLGSGLGGLPWPEVRKRIEAAFRNVDVEVIVFEPNAAYQDSREVRPSRAPKMTPGRAALVALMRRYLSGLLDPFVSLVELHKLMYFMQEAGEELQLTYNKAPYGPYAENLRHVLRAVEGYMISGYRDGGDHPDKPLELVPGAVDDAERFLANERPTRSRFDRVADLVEGFETPFGLELLATVHWVVAREGAANTAEAIRKIYAWGDRKRRFSESQIELAYNVLAKKGWLKQSPAA